MKKLTVLAALLSLAVVPAFGKSGAHTITGCLSGPNQEGAYELTTKSGQVEVTGASGLKGDLKSHVGHEVKLTGTYIKSPTASSATEKTDAKTGTTSGERYFKATSIHHVSDTCTAPSSTKQ
jgi:hypothetical protein